MTENFVQQLLRNFEIALNQVAKFNFKCQSFICCLNKLFKDKLVTKYKRVIFDKETYTKYNLCNAFKL